MSELPPGYRTSFGPELNGQSAERGPRIRLTVIGDVEAKRVIYLEEGLIPCGMVTAVVAPGGTVKGLWGIHIAVKLAARGERTLFLCSEDSLEYIIKPRFTAAGSDARL